MSASAYYKDTKMADNMKMKQFVVGPVQTNCYVVINTETQECIVVDPGDKGDSIAYTLRNDGLKPVAILLTHGHFDHICGVNEVKKAFGIDVYVHERDSELISDPEKNDSLMFIGKGVSVEADKLLHGGEQLDFAGFKIDVLHTPGHTPGSVCYYIKEKGVLLSGDTLFQMSVGRTDLPGGSMSSLVSSLKEKVITLPEDTVVYPGHGEATSIEVEKKYNPFL